MYSFVRNLLSLAYQERTPKYFDKLSDLMLGSRALPIKIRTLIYIRRNIEKFQISNHTYKTHSFSLRVCEINAISANLA